MPPLSSQVWEQANFGRYEGFLAKFPQTCPNGCCAMFSYKFSFAYKDHEDLFLVCSTKKSNNVGHHFFWEFALIFKDIAHIFWDFTQKFNK